MLWRGATARKVILWPDIANWAKRAVLKESCTVPDITVTQIFWESGLRLFHELLITGSSWREENLCQDFFSLQKEIMKMAEVLNKSWWNQTLPGFLGVVWHVKTFLKSFVSVTIELALLSPDAELCSVTVSYMIKLSRTFHTDRGGFRTPHCSVRKWLLWVLLTKKNKLFSWDDMFLWYQVKWCHWCDHELHSGKTAVWKQMLVLLYWVLCEGRLVANQLSSLHVQLSG